MRLKNFKCHVDVQIGIPVNGTTLIKGESGKGKTSLLEGFLFILYDYVYKPMKLNSDFCEGYLVFGDLYVLRRKDEFLKVWIGEDEYDGDEAQK